ncbi:hypothetical protein H2200_012460 [Cladophialophora chaetospira]|uniref:Threonylcarbamoyl-AMP synthase n=1 Tax=Cladophialophora chaetospira TaxID=386627 RepID=A0AA38WXX2_9EURO|nr:hypothetical protein H2200_012460 [Cladophialophora chaetospira]
MTGTVDSLIKAGDHLSSRPYTKRSTRIVSLLDIDIPEHATDEEYRHVYRCYTQTASPQDPSSNASLLRDAVESIKYGISPPVAFPTETVYGLGADATNEPATSGIFAAKGRPSDNPLIVHAASISHLERVTGAPLPEVYKSVTEKFWPGPLTILLPVPSSSIFAKNVHPGQNTIGFRIPSSKYARFFIAATDRPLAGPSANSSGKPSPTTARHVLDDLHGKINFILDGGSCDVGVESTVVDGLHDPPLILRPGGVSLEEFRALGREVGGENGDKWARTTIGYKMHRSGDKSPSSNTQGSPTNAITNGVSARSTPLSESFTTTGTDGIASYEEDVNGAPRAPGMKYRHYAPRGRLILFSEEAFEAGRVAQKMDDIVDAAQSDFGILGREKKRAINIGIISCHWPPFAGLKDIAMTAIKSSETLHNGSSEDLLAHSDYANATSTARIQHKDTVITLFNVRLGPETSTLAHSLFGVLRLFDDLDCTYIFAETVRRSGATPFASSIPAHAAVNGEVTLGKERGDSRQARRDLEDAVMDRIEKAAAERVDCVGTQPEENE